MPKFLHGGKTRAIKKTHAIMEGMDMSKIPVGDLMTIQEAADFLKISRQTIYSAIERSALTAVPVLGKQRLLRSEVEAYQPQGFRGKRPSKNALGDAPKRPRGRPRKDKLG